MDQVRQSTFIKLASSITGGKYKVADSNAKLAALISPKTDEKEKALIKKAGRFKGSLVFLEALEQYVLELTEKTVPDKDFVLWGLSLIHIFRPHGSGWGNPYIMGT